MEISFVVCKAPQKVTGKFGSFRIACTWWHYTKTMVYLASRWNNTEEPTWGARSLAASSALSRTCALSVSGMSTRAHCRYVFLAQKLSRFTASMSARASCSGSSGDACRISERDIGPPWPWLCMPSHLPRAVTSARAKSAARVVSMANAGR